MVLWPSELGRSVMKSMAMWDHGRSGMGRGWRRPAGKCREGFCVLQTWQWLTWMMVSLLRVGHQNRFWSNCTVALMPGWPELRAVWTRVMVLSRRFSGTNNLFSGQSGGMIWSEFACSISVMMSHWIGATTTVGEIIFSGGWVLRVHRIAEIVHLPWHSSCRVDTWP